MELRWKYSKKFLYFSQNVLFQKRIGSPQICIFISTGLMQIAMGRMTSESFDILILNYMMAQTSLFHSMNDFLPQVFSNCQTIRYLPLAHQN